MVKYSMSLCVLIFWRVWEGNCILAICPGANPWESRGKNVPNTSALTGVCVVSKSRGTVKGKINNGSGKVLSFERLQPKSISWMSRSPSVYLQLDGHLGSCAVFRSSRSQAAGSEHGFLFFFLLNCTKNFKHRKFAPSTAHARTHAFLPVSVCLVPSHVSRGLLLCLVSPEPHTQSLRAACLFLCVFISLFLFLFWKLI